MTKLLILMCFTFTACSLTEEEKATIGRYERYNAWYEENWNECWRAGGKVDSSNYSDSVKQNISMRCMVGGKLEWVRDFPK